GTERKPGAPATGPRDSGALPAGLDVEARHRGDGVEARHRDAAQPHEHSLSGRAPVRQPLLPLLDVERARRSDAAGGDRAERRRLLLPAGHEARSHLAARGRQRLGVPQPHRYRSPGRDAARIPVGHRVLRPALRPTGLDGGGGAEPRHRPGGERADAGEHAATVPDAGERRARAAALRRAPGRGAAHRPRPGAGAARRPAPGDDQRGRARHRARGAARLAHHRGEDGHRPEPPRAQPLLGVTVALALFGFAALYSAGQTDVPTVATTIWQKQLVWLGVGLLAAVLAFRLSPRLLEWATPYAYTLIVLLLLLTLAVGTGGGTAAGSKSWIGFAGVRLGQPAELGKLVTILMLARWLAERRAAPITLRELAYLPFPFPVLGPPAGFPLLSPLVIAGVPFLL